jgi:hypothetical protein
MKLFSAIAFLLLFLPALAQQKKPVYKRFSGTITVIDADVIKYDDELLVIYKTDNYLKKVFESGLLFPGMFKYPGKTYQKKDTPNSVVHNFTVASCQWINSKSGKIRLFKLVLVPNNNQPAEEYYIELYSPNGTSKSDFNNFIREAQLTSFKRGRILD